MSSDNSQRYNQRGVSASKEDVHNAIKNIDKGLFPKAFCKIVPDYLTNDNGKWAVGKSQKCQTRRIGYFAQSLLFQ